MFENVRSYATIYEYQKVRGGLAGLLDRLWSNGRSIAPLTFTNRPSDRYLLEEPQYSAHQQLHEDKRRAMDNYGAHLHLLHHEPVASRVRQSQSTS